MSRSALVLFAVAVAAAAGMNCANAFVPPPNTRIAKEHSALYFGIPTFGAKDNKEPKKDEEKIGLSGLVQLITAGMGSPFLGNFEGVDEETGKFMFSLEANNLVDEDGQSKQTKMPYFESGWVDEADLEKERERKANGFKFPWQN